MRPLPIEVSSDFLKPGYIAKCPTCGAKGEAKGMDNAIAVCVLECSCERDTDAKAKRGFRSL